MTALLAAVCLAAAGRDCALIESAAGAAWGQGVGAAIAGAL